MRRVLIALVSSLFIFTGCHVRPLASWEFDGSVAAWKPLEDSVHLSVDTADPKSDGGCLHLTGGIAEASHYFHGPVIPATTGQAYRMTAWMRIDSHGRYTPPPHLRVAALPAQAATGEFSWNDAKPVASFRTPLVRVDMPGKWQRIEHDFRVPDGAGAICVALKKYEGWSKMPTEIDLRMDDLRIEPIANLSAWDKYDLAPLPDGLKRAAWTHPRLFADEARFAEIRREAEGANAHVWKRVRAAAEKAMKEGPPADEKAQKRGGGQQTWQRPVGDKVALFAFCYRVSGDPKYLEAALEWARFSCDRPSWGEGPTYRNNDLAAGHQLLGLALLYDWCLDDLDATTRKRIRSTIFLRGTECFEAIVSGSAWHWQSYMQNHLWVTCGGLGTAGLALYDEFPMTRAWIGLANEKMRRSVEVLGSDGASHEGPLYWRYGTSFMLPYLTLMDDLMGEDLIDGSDWWKNTSGWLIHMCTPRSGWKPGRWGMMVANYGDSSRPGGGAHVLRALARRFQDGRIQWWADTIEAGTGVDSSRAMYSMLWRDPTLKPVAPAAGDPTVRHCEDMGIVAARPSWDKDTSYLFFKCGPTLGHEAVERFASYDPGGGHVHPDANSFALFGAGQWLLRDDFYNSRDTGGHNTLLVAGRGQLNEGARNSILPLLVRSNPRILAVEELPAGVVHIAAEAAEAYPEELGLQRFERHALYFRETDDEPGALVVLDDIALSMPRELELRFRPEAETKANDAGVCVMQGKKAVMRLQLLTPDGVGIESGIVPVDRGHKAKARPLPGIRMRRAEPTDAWRNAVAATWAKKGGTPAQATLKQDGDIWEVRFGKRSAKIDWATRQVQGVE